MRELTMVEVQDVSGAGFWTEVLKFVAGELASAAIYAGVGKGDPDAIIDQQIKAPPGTFG